MTRRAVISGASIAGLSAAFWLRRTGWEVTVLERSSSFRDGGQNVDLRGVSRDVLTRMDLFDAVKAQNTTETAAVFVDDAGRVTGELPGGPDGATAELEVLRGDLARTILDHLPDGVEFVYGDTVEDVADGPDELVVTTAAGRSIRADLLVIAEGVHSSTRDRLFGDAVGRRDLGICCVYGTIPRTADDDTRWRWHTTVGGRTVHLRPDNHGTTRAMLAFTTDDDLTALDTAAALAVIRERYAGAGWAAPRVLDGFDTSDDVYVDQLVQIKMPRWHRGRVVLAGDAAWCVTPIGGGGASLALTSGYVLAAFLRQHPDDVEHALAAYQQWLRPLVDDVQNIPPGIRYFAYPKTHVGLALRRVADRILTSRLFRPIAARFTQVAETDRTLPAL